MYLSDRLLPTPNTQRSRISAEQDGLQHQVLLRYPQSCSHLWHTVSRSLVSEAARSGRETPSLVQVSFCLPLPSFPLLSTWQWSLSSCPTPVASQMVFRSQLWTSCKRQEIYTQYYKSWKMSGTRWITIMRYGRSWCKPLSYPCVLAC